MKKEEESVDLPYWEKAAGFYSVEGKINIDLEAMIPCYSTLVILDSIAPPAEIKLITELSID